MSLSPIPSRMLHDSAKIYVVTGMDRYQEKIYDTYEVKNVHMQSDTDVLKGADNTEVQLKGTLFVDGSRSTPQLDYTTLQQTSLDHGGTMRAEVYDASGKLQGNYAVLIVNGLPDVPATRVHHWELSLV